MILEKIVLLLEEKGYFIDPKTGKKQMGNMEDAINVFFDKILKDLNQEYSQEKNLKEEEIPSDPIDTITMDVPLFLRILEYAREDAQEDIDLHDVTQNAISGTKEKGILSMEDYEALISKGIE
jgi:hypothetical protein